MTLDQHRAWAEIFEALNSFDAIAQVWILLMQVPSIWLLNRTDSLVRWGCVLGLAAQPAYFYACWQAKQWGMLVLTAWFTYCFAQGVYNHFWRTHG